MANSLVVNRAQLVYALCLPLAVLVGYVLADPSDFGSVLMVTAVIGVLSIPLLMRWYHPLLVMTWNAAIIPYFLPGQPFLWMLLAFVGLGFALANRLANFETKFITVPSLNRPLLFLVAVILGTAFLRGGIGMRSLGSSQYGGRYYFYALAAIVGYYALSSVRIPKERANLAVGLFFLSGLTAIVPNLAFIGGESFNFLFYFFPAGGAIEQAMGEYSLTQTFARVAGLTTCSVALLNWLLVRHGIRGTLDWHKPWRFALLVLALGSAVLCGFRLTLLTCLFIFAFQFWFEGLVRLRNLLITGGLVLVTGALLLTNVQRLPLVAQRSLSFLPVEVNPAVQESARASYEWRMQMWQDVVPLIPKYLLRGKGYALDPAELGLASQGPRRLSMYEGAMEAGDYHNGPLTVVIPFGIWGVFGFGWFLVASLKFLYRNYRHGEPELRAINTLLLATFAARMVIFLGLYGMFACDFFIFTGLLALSVSLNGVGVEPVEETEELTEAAHQERFAVVQDRG